MGAGCSAPQVAWMTVIPTLLGAMALYLFLFQKLYFRYLISLLDSDLVKFAKMLFGFYKLLQIAYYWAGLYNEPIQGLLPANILPNGWLDHRCFPFVDAMQASEATLPEQFRQPVPMNRSGEIVLTQFDRLLFQYDFSTDRTAYTGIRTARLCTDAPEAVVLKSFNSSMETFGTSLDTWLDKSRCRTFTCDTENYKDVEKWSNYKEWRAEGKDKPSCTTLLKTPPTANDRPNGMGFLWVSSFKSSPLEPVPFPECTFTLVVDRTYYRNGSVSCPLKYVYFLESNATASIFKQRVAAYVFGVPMVVLVVSFIIGCWLRCRIYNKEPIDDCHQCCHAFAKDTWIGSACFANDVLKCAFCQDFRSVVSKQNCISFLVHVALKVLEIVGFFLAFDGCAICRFLDIYYLQWLNFIFLAQYIWTYIEEVCGCSDSKASANASKESENELTQVT
jgi:hypothetical protein